MLMCYSDDFGANTITNFPYKFFHLLPENATNVPSCLSFQFYPSLLCFETNLANDWLLNEGSAQLLLHQVENFHLNWTQWSADVNINKKVQATSGPLLKQ